MGDKEARIRIGLDGAQDVRAGLRGVKGDMEGVRESAGKSTSALKGLGDAARRIAVDFAAASSGMKAVNFEDAKQKAKAYEDQITRLAIRTGQSAGTMAADFRSVGERIGVMPERVAQGAKALTRMTMDSTVTKGVLEQLGHMANNAGDEFEDWINVGAKLRTEWGTTFDRMGSQLQFIERLGASVPMGLQGMVRQVEQLGGVVERLGIRSDKTAREIMGFGALRQRQGLTPGQAAGGVGSLLSTIESLDPVKLMNTVRAGGMKVKNLWDVMDPRTGEVREDKIMPVLSAIKKAYGKLGGAGPLAMMQELGRGGAAALMNFDEKQVEYEGRGGLAGDLNRRGIGAFPLGTAPNAGGYNAREANKLYKTMPEETRKWLQGRGLIPNEETLNQLDDFMGTRAGGRAQREAERRSVELREGSWTAQNEDAYQNAWKGHRGEQAMFETLAGNLPENWRNKVTGAAGALGVVGNLAGQDAEGREYERSSANNLGAIRQLLEQQPQQLANALRGQNQQPGLPPLMSVPLVPSGDNK